MTEPLKYQVLRVDRQSFTADVRDYFIARSCDHVPTPVFDVAGVHVGVV